MISDVIDMEQSEAWKDGSATAFVTDDSELVLELNKEPGVKGSLKTACSVSDALVLQCFEEHDAVKAAFGHELTFEQSLRGRTGWEILHQACAVGGGRGHYKRHQRNHLLAK